MKNINSFKPILKYEIKKSRAETLSKLLLGEFDHSLYEFFLIMLCCYYFILVL